MQQHWLGRLLVAGALALAVASGACASAPGASPAAPAGKPGGAPAGSVAPVAAGGAAGAAAAGSGAAATSAPAPPPPMRVTLAPPSSGVIFMPYYFGQAKGLYATEGVELELQVLPANTAIAAVLAGELDFTAAAGSAGRAAVAANSPMRVVMGLIDQSMIDLHVSREIGSLQDLRGRQIAITSIAGTPVQVGRRVLAAGGVNPEGEVEFVQTQVTANAYAALLAGGVAAALLDPPFTAMADARGYRALAQGRDYVRSTQGGLATSTQRLQEQPEKMARAIRGSLRSIAYVLDNEDEVVEYIQRTWELEPRDARLTYQNLAPGLVRDGLTAPSVFLEELEAAGLQATVDQVIDFGILRRVLEEPAFRETCAARAGATPAGCRAK